VTPEALKKRELRLRWLKEVKKRAYREGLKEGYKLGEANARAMMAIVEHKLR
jgi:flagellar biosynthesis/type III secretory pathway protein FliH